MTEKMSPSFLGNKRFKKQHYDAFVASKTISEGQVCQIFSPYTQKLKQISSQDNTCSLLSLFTEFICESLKKFYVWQFQKISSWIQISAHVFQYSFENCLNKKQSFQYFSQVLVRHSLFRPPHSVNVFEYEQCKKMMDYWIATFCRFYQEYSLCFMPDLNQIITTQYSGFAPLEAKMKNGKQYSREQFSKKFGQIIHIELNKKPAQQAPPAQ